MHADLSVHRQEQELCSAQNADDAQEKAPGRSQCSSVQRIKYIAITLEAIASRLEAIATGGRPLLFNATVYRLLLQEAAKQSLLQSAKSRRTIVRTKCRRRVLPGKCNNIDQLHALYIADAM